MKKYVLILLVLLVAIFGVYYVRSKKAADGSETPPSSKVAVQRGAIVHSVESSGSLASNLDVEIKCKASGEIISLPYDESDTVEKGMLVMELDPVDEERNVSKAEVTLSSARARLEKSRQNLKIAEQELGNSRRRAEVTLAAAKVRAKESLAKEERVKELFEKKLASKEELDSEETAAAQARADLEKAEIAIEELKTQEAALELRRQDVQLSKDDMQSADINLGIARQRLDDTKVYAPIDGVITSRFVQEGQIISSATSNVGGGTTVMTISDLTKLYVVSSVDESDIGSVRPGQEVEITADAFPDQRFRGVVDRIAPKGQNVSNVVTFEVRIEVLQPGGPAGGPPGGMGPGGGFDREAMKREMENMSDEDREKMKHRMSDSGKMQERGGGSAKAELKPEMTANVKIIIAQKDDALMVPSEAVSRIKGKQTVSVVTGEGEPEEREVETGIGDGINIEIVSGLKEGEKVLARQNSLEGAWSRDASRRMPMGAMMKH
ncbi:MAG: HlyD family efflux transporter periplasmic adaptor subunit [bacterium]